MTSSAERISEFTLDSQQLWFEVTKISVQHSINTLKRISHMAYIIFGVGIVLFCLSAVSGLIRNQSTDAATFGELGVVSFVLFFIFVPTGTMQNALSNLLQANAIYMNFWNQVNFWMPYANSDVAHTKREGSAQILGLTKSTTDMLEEYIEKNQGHDLMNWRNLLQHGNTAQKTS
jgi:hypothetical protein